MLSQDDRRQLEMIEHLLEVEDPEFARALGEGRPRRPRGDCRWPLRLVLALAGLVFLTGLLTQAIWVVLLGVCASICAGMGYWLQVRRSQGRPIRRGRRSS